MDTLLESSAGRVGVIVGSIFLIRTAFSFFAKKTPVKRSPKPVTTSERLSFYTLLVFAIWCAYNSWTVPAGMNFFGRIGIEIDAYSSHILRQLNAYINANTLTEMEVDDLTRTYDKIMTTDGKEMYVLYGDALTKCNWCTDPSDYAMFTLPNLLRQTLLLLVVVGLCTGGNRQSYRLYCVILAFYEMAFQMAILTGYVGISLRSLFAASFEIVEELVPEMTLKFETDATLLHRLRFAVFAAFCFIAAVFPKKKVWTEQDILLKLVDENNRGLSQLVAANTINNIRQVDKKLSNKVYQNDIARYKSKLAKEGNAEFIVFVIDVGSD
jgi:hypothetical protein